MSTQTLASVKKNAKTDKNLQFQPTLKYSHIAGNSIRGSCLESDGTTEYEMMKYYNRPVCWLHCLISYPTDNLGIWACGLTWWRHTGKRGSSAPHQRTNQSTSYTLSLGQKGRGISCKAYWHWLTHSIQSRVYASVRRPSVCLSHPATACTAAGLLLWPGRQKISIDCRMARWMNADRTTLSAYVEAEHRDKYSPKILRTDFVGQTADRLAMVSCGNSQNNARNCWCTYKTG